MSIVIMSATIKLFELTREYYETVGVHPSTSLASYTFNWRSFLTFYILTAEFVSTATYFLFKTNITIDYVETLQSFYFSSTSFNFLVTFMINYWKMSKIFMLMDRFEDMVQKSKLNFHSNWPHFIRSVSAVNQ